MTGADLTDFPIATPKQATATEAARSRATDLVHRQYSSGKHHGVVRGVGLVTLLWTDGGRRPRVRARVRPVRRVVLGPGGQPQAVPRAPAAVALTRLRHNRRMNPDRTGPRAVSECQVAATGTVVHLAGYGMVKVFRLAATDGTADHWATDEPAD